MSRGDPEKLLEATGVRKHFKTDTDLLSQLLGNYEYVKAVDGVDLDVFEEEVVGIVGESGCGKTTLGRTLARLYEPTAGTIQFKGTDIATSSGEELKAIRKDLQITYQDPTSSLNPRKTIREILGKPLTIHDLVDGRADKKDRINDMLREVGLGPEFKNRYPHEMSGGQKQRIGIARSLIIEPDLMVVDEPVSALDVSVQAQILNLMADIQEKYGLSYVFIAHDLSVVKHICDRVAVMYLGKIVERGPTDEIFANAHHPYTRALLSSIPDIDQVNESRIDVPGNPPSPINPPSGCSFRDRCPEYIGDECAQAEPTLQPVGDGATAAGAGGTNHASACHWNNHPTEARVDHTPPDRERPSPERE